MDYPHKSFICQNGINPLASLTTGKNFRTIRPGGIGVPPVQAQAEACGYILSWIPMPDCISPS
jgi:hypothetical protein